MKTVGLIILGLFALVLGFAISSALFGWLGMLSIGILFAEGVIPSTISFVSALWLGLIYSFLVSLLAAGAASKN
jgi:hypothetical protein